MWTRRNDEMQQWLTFFATVHPQVSQSHTLPSFHWLTPRLHWCSWTLKTSCVSRIGAHTVFAQSLASLHCSFQQCQAFCAILSLFNSTVLSESPSIAKKMALFIDTTKSTRWHKNLLPLWHHNQIPVHAHSIVLCELDYRSLHTSWCEN